jgi:Cu(I)/Ag(I) efflux system membrane fusion protein
MNESENNVSEQPEEVVTADLASAEEAAQKLQRRRQRIEARRWWLRLFVQPLIFLAAIFLLIAALGITQRFGWISAEGSKAPVDTAVDESVSYICPMMCTPPRTEPGRCPVCAMELVPVTSGGGSGGSRTIQIDPVARRVAHIQTVAVKRTHVTRSVKAIGELNYNEGTMKTIAAYVDGRIERLYADYTGVVVGRGDQLALVYSPHLYSGQVEFLLAKKARDESRTSTLSRVVQSSRDLYESARQRLIEFGMTEAQIEELEQGGEANSRLQLFAPISGTVIEKLAVEGQYVKEGQAIYRLADLSTVWLMLRLFPDDATAMRYGQKVEATVQSLPGRTFTGRVAFVDPSVDPATRTVGIRVVIPNLDGALRVGDYAKAAVEVSLPAFGDSLSPIYDEELANKWISPRHPHIIETAPGTCRICGIALVPASQFGFTDDPEAGGSNLTVPRDAVLMAGDNSVVYVEVEPGRFEIRSVELGPSSDDQIVVLDGVKEGERVATRGNFLIDSQMQLAGNPSLIDPTKATVTPEATISPGVLRALAQLSEEDRRLAERQKICPVTKYPLGSMGIPPKVIVDGRIVFICCEGCREALVNDFEKYMSELEEGGAAEGSGTEGLAPDLPPLDLPMVELPPMGVPELVEPDSDKESREVIR